MQQVLLVVTTSGLWHCRRSALHRRVDDIQHGPHSHSSKVGSLSTPMPKCQAPSLARGIAAYPSQFVTFPCPPPDLTPSFHSQIRARAHTPSKLFCLTFGVVRRTCGPQVGRSP
jgi:hypothetical protein